MKHGKEKLFYPRDTLKTDKINTSKISIWISLFAKKVFYSKYFIFSLVFSIILLIAIALNEIVDNDIKSMADLIAAFTDIKFILTIVSSSIVAMIPIILSISNTIIVSRKSYVDSFNVKNPDMKKYIQKHIVSNDLYQKNGYKWYEYKDEKYEMSDEVNNFLVKSNFGKKIKFTVDKKMFKIPEASLKNLDYKIKERVDKNLIIFNGHLVRLGTDIVNDDNLVIKMQKTDYFSNIATNDSIYEISKNYTDINYSLDGYQFSVDGSIDMDKEKEVKLLNLSTSYCANIIGISTLAITKDRKIIVLVQGSGEINTSKLVPSGSGSAEFCNIKKFNNFNDYLCHEMHREMLEEVQVSKVNFKILNNTRYDIRNYTAKTYLIGYCRLLERGGKPDFFGITELNDLDSSVLKDYFYEYCSRREAEVKKLEKQKELLVAKKNHFLFFNEMKKAEKLAKKIYSLK